MTIAQDVTGGLSSDFLVVGQLGRAHGVKGEIRMMVFTDFPERLKIGQVLYIGDQHLPLEIVSCRWRQRSPGPDNTMLVMFAGYDQRETVEMLRNQIVCVPASDRPPLPDGEYYQHQLLGLLVIDEDGKRLGVLSEILRTGANDVYVITPENGPEILCPAIASTILGVNLERGEIKVYLLPGLVEP